MWVWMSPWGGEDQEARGQDRTLSFHGRQQAELKGVLGAGRGKEGSTGGGEDGGVDATTGEASELGHQAV